jgi:hypothetical protein
VRIAISLIDTQLSYHWDARTIDVQSSVNRLKITALKPNLVSFYISDKQKKGIRVMMLDDDRCRMRRLTDHVSSKNI